MFGRADIPLVLPQGRGDFLGGAGPPLPVNQVGKQLLALPSAEDDRLSVPEHLKGSEAAHL